MEGFVMKFQENCQGIGYFVENLSGMSRKQLQAIQRIAGEYLKESELKEKQEKQAKPKLSARDMDFAIRELNQIRKLKLSRTSNKEEQAKINAKINAKIAKIESEYNNQDYQKIKSNKNQVQGKIGKVKTKTSKTIKTIKDKKFEHDYNDLHDYQNDWDDLTSASWLDISTIDC